MNLEFSNYAFLTQGCPVILIFWHVTQGFQFWICHWWSKRVDICNENNVFQILSRQHSWPSPLSPSLYTAWLNIRINAVWITVWWKITSCFCYKKGVNLDIKKPMGLLLMGQYTTENLITLKKLSYKSYSNSNKTGHQFIHIRQNS